MAVTDPNALWAQALSDPSVTAGKSGLRGALINAYLNYGDPSSLFAANGAVDPATGQPTTLAALYGIGQNDVSGAATNPYSTLKQLGDQAAGTQQATNSNLAGRNLEFSGSAAAHAQANTNADQLRQYNARQGLGGTLSGIGQQYSGLITGAYNTLMGNAANDPTIPATPAAPAPSLAPDNSFGNGYVATAPATPAVPVSAQWGVNPQAPQNQFTPPKIPKVKQLTGYQGHA